MKPHSPPTAPVDSRRIVRSSRLLVLAALFAIAAFAALLVDLPVAAVMLAESDGRSLPGDVRKAVWLSEVFAHGFGVAMILATVVVLDPRNRRAIWRLVACAFLPGGINLIIKGAIGRGRPYFLQEQYGELPDRVGETFLGWFASTNPGQFGADTANELQSFASGHAATAVGLAIGLAWLYPRGWWLFAAFATLAAFQRVASGAHFVSDTLAAASLACLVCAFCIERRVLGQFFDRLERPWRGDSQQNR